MNCPTCNRYDEFVFEENTGVWRCDRCHEKFRIKPQQIDCDAAEEFVKVPRTNADRIRAMSDEELADWIDKMFNEGRDDWDPIGCYACMNWGTHHADPVNKGTRLYECEGCDFESSITDGMMGGILHWLQQPEGANQ